jgi:pyruvate,orthophosphate dikinase
MEQKLIKKNTSREFPQDPHEQLILARYAVFRYWNGDRANNISDDLGAGINVVSMVFGNLGEPVAPAWGLRAIPPMARKSSTNSC